MDHLVTNAGVAPLYLFEDIDDLSKAMPAMVNLLRPKIYVKKICLLLIFVIVSFSFFFSPQDINFWGSVYCTFFASSYLKKSRGKIVVIASGCGYIASPRLSFYCVTLFYPFAFSYLHVNLLILHTHLISLIFS